jgi:hypothetical protein
LKHQQNSHQKYPQKNQQKRWYNKTVQTVSFQIIPLILRL